MPGGRIENCYVLYTLLVDQSTQFSIDLARREVLGVELRALSVDFGDVRNGVVELDEAAGVEEDLLPRRPGRAIGARSIRGAVTRGRPCGLRVARYLVHTIT